MVENISEKILKMERKLPRPRNSSNSSILLPKTPSPQKIRLISTYGSDSELVGVVRNFQSNLEATTSFASSPDLFSTTPKNKTKLFQLVERTGSSLRNKLVKNKHMALGKHGTTVPCNHRNCQCCRIITTENKVNINGIFARPSWGNCATYNVIYCFVCILCAKGYVGRTTQQVNSRTAEHRRDFYNMLKNISNALTNEIYRQDDKYSLGLHLIEDHGCCNNTDFDASYKLFILDTCSPRKLEQNEHKFIQTLRTLKPHGLNAVDPFGIMLLKN